MAAAVAGTRWEALRPCARGMNAWLFVRSDEIPPALKPYRDFQKEWKLQLNDFTGAVYEGRLYGPDDFAKLESMPTRAQSYRTSSAASRCPPSTSSPCSARDRRLAQPQRNKHKINTKFPKIGVSCGINRWKLTSNRRGNREIGRIRRRREVAAAAKRNPRLLEFEKASVEGSQPVANPTCFGPPAWPAFAPAVAELEAAVRFPAPPPVVPPRPTSSPAMASAVAASTATRFLTQLSAPWLRRARVALLPSPPLPLLWRPVAVTVAAASRRSGGGEGGRWERKRRRARGTDQEEGLSLSSETETTNPNPHRRNDKGMKPVPESSARKDSAIRRVTLVVLAAVLFGVSIGLKDGAEKASEYFAGYLLEQSLSVDNLLVFVLVFKYFKVPKDYQSPVLSYGIAGAVVFRAVMIILGVATIQRFESVNLLLALILLFTSYKLFVEEDEEADLSDNFIVKTCQKFIPVTDYYDDDRFFTTQDGLWKATPLLLTLAVIELSDIAFAVDSIPAVFGVTRDPLIILSSNIFAISCLRSLYVLISESMAELEYLQPAIGIVLGFIGTKMIFDFFGYHIPTEASLAIVTTCLSGGVILSLRKASKEEQDK